MNLNKNDIDLWAQNAAAIKNGEDLIKKKKFIKLSKTSDDILLFGECAGSGKDPYFVSVDFIDEKSPVFRCSCPSRQIPCKHALGLMYSYINGATFSVEEIPEDISSKRERIEKRQEKKEQKKQESKEKKPMTKAQKTAAIKKIDVQLQGIDMAEKIIKSIVNMGIASIDKRERKNFEDQIKQLGNYYISGIQTALMDIFILKDIDEDNNTRIIDQLTYTYALINKSREYLNNKKEDPETKIELANSIEEQMGYAWKLDELISYNMKENDARLIQLCFYSYADFSRKEYIDEGYLISLNTGKLYKTKNYRPFKATRYIKEEDSIFSLLEVDELIIYPGAGNPRVRWDNFKTSPILKEHIEKIKSYASDNFNELAKQIKNMIKSPLQDKNIIALIKIDNIKRAKDKPYYIAEDKHKNKLTLGNISLFKEDLNGVLENLLSCDKDIVMAVMFENNIDSALLIARPLSILTDSKILRVLY